jgi:hypothetical protein
MCLIIVAQMNELARVNPIAQDMGTMESVRTAQAVRVADADCTARVGGMVRKVGTGQEIDTAETVGTKLPVDRAQTAGATRADVFRKHESCRLEAILVAPGITFPRDTKLNGAVMYRIVEIASGLKCGPQNGDRPTGGGRAPRRSGRGSRRAHRARTDEFACLTNGSRGRDLATGRDRTVRREIALSVNRIRARAAHSHNHGAREQRRGGLIQILIEQIRNLLFQIRRMIQSRELERFKRRHRRLQKKLIWQAIGAGHGVLLEWRGLSNCVRGIYRMGIHLVNITCGNLSKTVRIAVVCCLA